ncbi:unnamed protein product, partial [Adineta steineri]
MTATPCPAGNPPMARRNLYLRLQCSPEPKGLAKSLLQLTRDRRHEFEDLARSHTIVAVTLNDTDRISFDEKYTILKDKYNRLLENLTPRVFLLDEASHERNEFDQQNEHVQELYQQLQNEF